MCLTLPVSSSPHDLRGELRAVIWLELVPTRDFDEPGGLKRLEEIPVPWLNLECANSVILKRKGMKVAW